MRPPVTTPDHAPCLQELGITSAHKQALYNVFFLQRTAHISFPLREGNQFWLPTVPTSFIAQTHIHAHTGKAAVTWEHLLWTWSPSSGSGSKEAGNMASFNINPWRLWMTLSSQPPATELPLLLFPILPSTRLRKFCHRKSHWHEHSCSEHPYHIPLQPVVSDNNSVCV